jgi:hypothetical protein
MSCTRLFINVFSHPLLSFQIKVEEFGDRQAKIEFRLTLDRKIANAHAMYHITYHTLPHKRPVQR